MSQGEGLAGDAPAGPDSRGAGSSSPFFVSSIRGTIIENTSAGTLTQIPFFPKYEVELDPHRKLIPYPGKEHIERVLDEYSHQVKDLQRKLNESLVPVKTSIDSHNDSMAFVANSMPTNVQFIFFTDFFLV
ncbi:PREDICTED: coiled-coil domain-containing protein 158-like [Galeopterus variegatus]|uniref:Coiled-coil domain-containing protein 158-like n=1 Tax=Galeopterus variegatus TaxID=482537 RepID=A0ABM0RUA6_GALVR|nr:PREDICTED: coiled-coil domain-containing protein 158-like [Galeopterus variegatus]